MADRPPDGGDGGRRLERRLSLLHRRPSPGPRQTSKMPRRGNSMTPPDDVGEMHRLRRLYAQRRLAAADLARRWL